MADNNTMALIDLGAVDVILVGADFGVIAVRGYGPNPASVRIEPLDNNLYTEAAGAFGDMLVNKSYKANNMKLTVNILRNQFFYKKLKGIVALEKSGNSVLFSVLVKDNNTGEIYAAPQCVMKKDPGAQWGSEPEPNVEFEILMPGTIYTPPTLT
jgi:hypothetical protein